MDVSLFNELIQGMGFIHVTYGHVVMWVIGLTFILLAIVKNYEPLLLVPIGFVSDHMEVIYDLDTEAQAACDESGLTMVRAATVGTHPRFVQMIRELIAERISGAPRLAVGDYGPHHDTCPADCCPAPRRR